MLRIETIDSGDSAVLRLHGRLVGPWVATLAATCETMLTPARRLTLDLADVGFVDREGAALLQRLRRQAVTLSNCSAFVSEQLRTPPG